MKKETKGSIVTALAACLTTLALTAWVGNPFEGDAPGVDPVVITEADVREAITEADPLWAMRDHAIELKRVGTLLVESDGLSPQSAADAQVIVDAAEDILRTLAPPSVVTYRGHVDFDSGNEEQGVSPHFTVSKEIRADTQLDMMNKDLSKAASQRRDGTELEAFVDVDSEGRVLGVRLKPWKVDPPEDRTTKEK